MKSTNGVCLIKPYALYKESFIEAMKEFQAEGRNTDIVLSELESNFDAFIKTFEDQEKGVGLKEGYVPQTTLWLVDGGDFIGRVSLRHTLTETLLKEGGHIGYEIRPSRRRMGYGTKILELALPFAKECDIDPVLVTCDDDNAGSLRIIEKNGGILENIIEYNGKRKRRYCIHL